MKVLKKIGQIILALVIIFVILVVAGFFLKKKVGTIFSPSFLSKLPGYNDKASITTEYVKKKFSEESTLVTQKLTLEGYSNYNDEGVPILTKGDFVITYKAEVTAGINVKNIDVDVDQKNRVIHLKVPEAEIFSVKVDPSSVQYHDESVAIFNFDPKEDSDKAEALAEQDAKQKAQECGLLKIANDSAKSLLKGILEDSVQDYTIQFDKK